MTCQAGEREREREREREAANLFPLPLSQDIVAIVNRAAKSLPTVVLRRSNVLSFPLPHSLDK